LKIQKRQPQGIAPTNDVFNFLEKIGCLDFISNATGFAVAIKKEINAKDVKKAF